MWWHSWALKTLQFINKCDGPSHSWTIMINERIFGGINQSQLKNHFFSRSSYQLFSLLFLTFDSTLAFGCHIKDLFDFSCFLFFLLWAKRGKYISEMMFLFFCLSIIAASEKLSENKRNADRVSGVAWKF